MLRRLTFITLAALTALAGLLTTLTPRDLPVAAQVATPTLLPSATSLFTATPAGPTLPPTITPTPGPTFIITPTPSTTPGCGAPLPLVIGGRAYVRGGINVRAQPDVSSALVNYYSQNVTVRVLDGPLCDGLYVWWKVAGPGIAGWITQGYWLTPAELPADQQCAAPAALTVGGRALLAVDVRLRQEADDGALVLTVAPAGALVDVLQGPVCAGRYNWWLVRAVVVNVVYTGWMADGARDGGDRFVSDPDAPPTPACAQPTRLKVGGRGYVNHKPDQPPKNLRSAPGLNAPLVATLIDGIGFEVIGGPVCRDTYNWWQIRILSRPDVTGWLAEGGPANYWVVPGFDFNQFPPPGG